ncbi:hypothetical protein AAF712_015414 [Marasmius tenuissimus]|uniref:F-box domain-containing protein n=1 Tax=Marasmius tenuissimus TaxID=585030 RepID=A0ABR2ZBR5_9AGAR
MVPGIAPAVLRYQRSLSVAEVETAKAAISLLSEQIERQEAELKRLKESRIEYQQLFSPFRRVPAEILAHIILLAVERNVFTADPAQKHVSEAFTYAQVCRRWRDMTLATAFAWARISVTLQLDDTPYPYGIVRRLEACLARSKNKFLDLEVECTPCTAHTHPVTNQIISVLLSHSFQWQFLTYVQQSGGFDHQILFEDIDEWPTPHLQSLHVTLDHTANPIGLELSEYLISAEYSDLCISGREACFIPHRLLDTLMESRITSLRVEVYPDSVATLLSSCRSLDFAHFTLAKDPAVPDPTASPTIIPRRVYISKLFLEQAPGCGAMEATQFLERLTCPYLTSLTIRDSDSTPPILDLQSQSFSKTVVSFLSRSQAELAHLHLDRVYITALSFCEVLKAVPRLRKLELVAPRMIISSQRVTEGWAVRLQSMCLWPRTSNNGYPSRAALVPELRTLRLALDSESNLEARAFEETLQSRVGWGLESVFLHVRSRIERLDLVKLSRLNKGSSMAVRVVEGKDEKEIIGYYPDPVVGLRKHGWRDLLDGRTG